MFARVFDKNNHTYYKSMVYAIIGVGWFTRYILRNPNTQTFELVDNLDKSAQPYNTMVEIIQSDRTGFVIREGSQLLKYKHFCNAHGYQFADPKRMTGYPDVLENYAFLADLLTNHSVSVDKYNISIRKLSDEEDWNYILTQADADAFMKKFAGFHDSTLEKIYYSENQGPATVNAVFDNSGWFGIAELCFEGVQMLKIMPPTENHMRELCEATLIIENESVFWADDYVEKADTSFEGSIIRALNLKWRKL